MKIYISGGISKLDPNEARKRFADAEEALTELGYEVYNPEKIGRMMPNLEYKQYMRHDINMLLDSDAVVILPGWETSDGATAERYLAHACRIPIYNAVEFIQLKAGIEGRSMII